MTAVWIPRDSHFIETVLSIPRFRAWACPGHYLALINQLEIFNAGRIQRAIFVLSFCKIGIHLYLCIRGKNKYCPNSVGQVCPLRQGCPLKPSATPESKGPAAFAALTFLSSPTKGKPFGIPPDMRENPGTQPRIFPFLAMKTPTT